jgi:hypothetical protein
LKFFNTFMLFLLFDCFARAIFYRLEESWSGSQQTKRLTAVFSSLLRVCVSYLTYSSSEG